MAEKVKKLSIDELTRLAFYHAEQDRSSFLDAISHCGDAYADTKAEAQALVEQLREYRLKRWGRTVGESIEEGVQSVSISEIMGRPDTAFKVKE